MKPSIPKGTRDFSPLETARRNYIFNTIRDAFRLFGYSQIETPAMENLSTLMGKYGEEGDKLLYKILNSGDFLKSVDAEMLADKNLAKLASKMCDKGLRYDLTVPFARYVVQHRSELQFPFRRFQMQPVWRADRPQKGRYREFYQCDADVVGSDSLINEVELLSLLDYVYNKLGIKVMIKINNRKILAGIAEVIGAPDRLTDITVAIDKIDKIGLEAVEAEMTERGVSAESVAALRPLLKMQGDNTEKLTFMGKYLEKSEQGIKGIAELTEVLTLFNAAGHSCDVEFDVSLARGLSYYTGTIIEVKALDSLIGSISGGGRYDNLTGIFGMPGLSGVGVSFGADRIYDVLLEKKLFPDDLGVSPTVIMLNMGVESTVASIRLISELRNEGISAIMYPDAVKMKKQMMYANASAIPFVGIIGEDELAEQMVTLKDMRSGEQCKVVFADIASAVKEMM